MAAVDRLDLLRAHRLARVPGSLDEALANPALAICLRNLAAVIARRATTHPSVQLPDVKRLSAGDRTDRE